MSREVVNHYRYDTTYTTNYYIDIIYLHLLIISLGSCFILLHNLRNVPFETNLNCFSVSINRLPKVGPRVTSYLQLLIYYYFGHHV